MTESKSDPLVEALDWLRSLYRMAPNLSQIPLCAARLEREFDRLQAIETAAREYIEEHENPASDLLYRRTLREQLAEALRKDKS